MHAINLLAAFALSSSPTPANGLRSAANAAPATESPNIVLMFADDQGYADVGVYGAQGFETPHLDRMAAEGMRFTDFYVAQPVCSASRAALLTGCYPNRIGIRGALGPKSRFGLADGELTLAELCKSRGYATAIFGKWHLGVQPRFLPMRHGFDEFYGIPYSNDMWPYHPENPSAWGDLPTLELGEVVGKNTDQNQFTTDFTERGVDFIKRSVAAETPFFLYLPHPMPHVPLHVHPERRGKTKQGLYGDVIAEIDWSMGRILETLEELDVADNTFVIYTSDNGPWLSYGDRAGSTGPLREGKGTTFEGGVRVPCLMRWPGRIPEGSTCSEPAMTIDVLPTVAAILDADLPEHPIDGEDIRPLIFGKEGARSPHEALFFWYHDCQLEAMRSGKWKLHFPHGFRSMQGRAPGKDGIPGKYDHSRKIGLSLFDLRADLGETTNVASQHPEVMARLQALADEARKSLGDKLKKIDGADRRHAGLVGQGD